MVDRPLLGDALLAIHEGVFRHPLETFKEATLQDLRRLLPFDAAIWATGRNDPLEIVGVTMLDYPAERVIEYATRWQAQDIIRLAAAQNPGRALRNEDVMPLADYHASAIYREFSAPTGIEHALGIVLFDPITQIGELLFLFRADAAAFFTDAERDRMDVLMPHLSMAARHRLSLHFNDQAAQVANLGGALRGYAVIDDFGRVHSADRFFGPAMQRSFPGWSGPTIPDALIDMIGPAAAMRDTGGQRFRLRPGNDRHLLTVEASSASALTLAEDRVARAYAGGLSAPQIARAFGLSPYTVRNQLAASFAKLGVHSKLELARLFGSANPP